MSIINERLRKLKETATADLLNVRLETQVERSNIESKLDSFDIERQAENPNDYYVEHITTDPDWLRRTEYAYRTTGILIMAIDMELGRRKKKEYYSFAEAFVKAALQQLPTDIVEKLTQDANQIIVEKQEEFKRLNEG